MNASMFTQLLGVFHSFFSRSFWFGSFLPVAVVAVLHLFIAAEVFRGLKPWDWATASGAATTRFPLLFAALIVLSYAMTPLLPLIRGILDGSLLPAWLHDGLRGDHVREAREMRDRITEAFRLLADYQRLREVRPRQFKDQRDAGLAVGEHQPQLIQAAEAAIRDFQKRVYRGSVPALQVAETTCDSLDRALATNSAAVNPRLEAAQTLLIRLLNDADADATHNVEMLTARYRTALALDNPQATRMGDARMLTERYSYDAFRVTFDYLWPRLEMAMPDQGALFDRMVAARAQIDFAMLSLLLIISVAVVWIPVLVCMDTSPWLFLAIGTVTPVLVGFLYQLAFESQITFGEMVKALMDRYRFDVLTTVLSQPLPATLSAERYLWTTLQNSAEKGMVTDLVYKQVKP